MKKMITVVKGLVSTHSTDEETSTAKKARNTPWRQGQKGPLWRENPYFENHYVTQSEEQQRHFFTSQPDFTSHHEMKDKIENWGRNLTAVPNSPEKIQSTPLRKSLSTEMIQPSPSRSPSRESLVFSPASPSTPRLLKPKENSSPSTPRGPRYES